MAGCLAVGGAFVGLLAALTVWRNATGPAGGRGGSVTERRGRTHARTRRPEATRLLS